MKNKILLITISLLSLLILACDSGTGTRVTIRTGLGTDARAATPPVAIGTLALKVTGADNYLLENNYTGVPSAITVNLPGPGDYTFELTALVDSAANSPILSYDGTASASLVEGSNTVSMTMAIKQVKLLIPDYTGNRVAQIDSFGDETTWSTIDGTDLLAVNAAILTNNFQFQPHGLDLDSAGNIYIANNSSGTDRKIIRLNAFPPTVVEDFTATEENFLSLAIDHSNSLMYYITSNTLYRKGLTASSTETAIPITEGDIPSASRSFYGIAVDSEGYLYLTNNNFSAAGIYKFSINAADEAVLIDAVSNSFSPDSWGIMVRNDTLFVTDLGYEGDPFLLSIDRNTMTTIDTLPHTPGSTPLNGPRLFVAIYNRDEIIFTDEMDYSYSTSNLVKIDDIQGNGYQTYGTYGSGMSQFKLYTGC